LVQNAMTTPDYGASSAVRENRGALFPAFWTAAAFPLSLSSPGATVAIGMLAAFGLYSWARSGALPADLRIPGAIALAAWLMLILVDVANGGGKGNLTTLVDYLPLAILAPLAYGFRLAGPRFALIERAMQATVLLAVASSLFQALWLGVARPGGLNLNPIPYAFVVLLWGTFLLSSGLEAGRKGALSVAIALSASIPILLSGSKMVWACTFIAYGAVTISWAAAGRRLKMLVPAAALAVAVLFLAGLSDMAARRLIGFQAEIEEFLATGMSSGDSLGNRLEMIRSGLMAFLDSPVLGHGLTESMRAALAFRDPNGPDISVHTHIHNDYIVHLVSFGVFGLVFLGIYFWLLVRLSLDCSMASCRRAGLAITVALSLYILADIAFNMDPMSSAMAIVAGLLLAFRNEGASRDSKPPPEEGTA
jgi:O-antigen ligase